jgi:hypothetical protein
VLGEREPRERLADRLDLVDVERPLATGLVLAGVERAHLAVAVDGDDFGEGLVGVGERV